MVAAWEIKHTRAKKGLRAPGMWVLDQLGPDGRDPDWSPETLASDTLDALALTASQASAFAECWHDLVIEQIRELRRNKNLTARLGRFVSHFQSGPTRDQLLIWRGLVASVDGMRFVVPVLSV